jgi:hypothetical protein
LDLVNAGKMPGDDRVLLALEVDLAEAELARAQLSVLKGKRVFALGAMSKEQFERIVAEAQLPAREQRLQAARVEWQRTQAGRSERD